MHSRILRPCLAAAKGPEPILAFLIPSTQCPRKAPAAQFSTSPTRCKSDNNKIRGLSAVRATGLRKGRKSDWTKIWAKTPGEIPRPKPIKQKVTGTPDHGLWDFFKDRKLLTTPLDESRHGSLLTYSFFPISS
jgi:large subunit ribosomal protein L47